MVRGEAVLALFDVDGTLIRTEGKSRHSVAFKAAFEKVYGRECRFAADMHGMTDRQIYLSLAESMGLSDGRGAELATDACRVMVELYAQPLEESGSYVGLPGARQLLELLQEKGVILGLLTGNAPEIAQDKLASVGLDRYFTFGAFGTEGDDRSALPPLAVARAEELTGRRIARRNAFVIGDTPRDVSCALDNGLRAVAVATGFVSMERLAATGAELVLPSLEDPTALLVLLDSAMKTA